MQPLDLSVLPQQLALDYLPQHFSLVDLGRKLPEEAKELNKARMSDQQVGHTIVNAYQQRGVLVSIGNAAFILGSLSTSGKAFFTEKARRENGEALLQKQKDLEGHPYHLAGWRRTWKVRKSGRVDIYFQATHLNSSRFQNPSAAKAFCENNNLQYDSSYFDFRPFS
jgi:hypothetical protein